MLELTLLSKHLSQHKHVCPETDCPRSKKGFVTINDLERHQKSVHNIAPGHGQSRRYKCIGSGCPKASKTSPRRDNFSHHLKHMHPEEDIQELMQRQVCTTSLEALLVTYSRSTQWYDKQQAENVIPSPLNPSLFVNHSLESKSPCKRTFPLRVTLSSIGPH